jgi:hypothetical protein
MFLICQTNQSAFPFLQKGVFYAIRRQNIRFRSAVLFHRFRAGIDARPETAKNQRAKRSNQSAGARRYPA